MSDRHRQAGASLNGAAILAGTIIAASSTLGLLATSGHVHRVADRPLPLSVGDVALPTGVFHWLLPLLLVALQQLARRTHNSLPGSLPLATALVLPTLGAVWLGDLVRHDRWMSLYHCALIVLVVWSAHRKKRGTAGWLGLAAIMGLLMLVSFGAIWGETRCREQAPVRCLVSDGPRVWIPTLLESVGVPVFAELNRADLRGLDLANRDLRYATLTGARLAGARLDGANLRRARLDNVRARQSSWRGAYLDGATLAQADLRGSDLRNIHGYRVDLREADLRNCELSQASLSHALLLATQLDGARLPGAYLRFTEGLVAGQLATACGDNATRLPAGFDVENCAGQ